MQFHPISHNSPAPKINIDEIKASIERKIHSLYEARYTPQNIQTLLQKVLIQADVIVSGDCIYRMTPGGVYQAITFHESEYLARDSLRQKVECDYKKVFSEIEHILKQKIHTMTVMQELLDFVRELIKEVTTVVFIHVSHHTFCDLVSDALDCIRDDAFDRHSNLAKGVFAVNGIVHTTVPYRAITSKEQMRPLKITKQLRRMEIPKTPSQIPPKSLNGIKHRPQLEALQGLLANAILSNVVEPQTFVQFTGSGAAQIVSEIKAFAGSDYVAAIPCAFTIASRKAPKVRDHGSRILIFDSSNSNVRSAGKALEKLNPEPCAALLPIISTEADGTPIMAQGWKCLYVTCDESNPSNSTESNIEWFQWLLGAFQKPKQYNLQALLQSPNEISDTIITELLQAFVNEKEIVANSHSNPSKIKLQLSDILRQIQHRANTAGMTSLKLTQKTIARILEHRLGFTIANQHNRLFVKTSGS